MARISGVDLPREKRIEIGLTYVYGIGRVRATKILEAAQVNPDTRIFGTAFQCRRSRQFLRQYTDSFPCQCLWSYGDSICHRKGQSF